MDQLTAYQVLGLKSDSSLEEVKEAYAALSKQYHPEEYPEKFQEIHEAYVTLTRRRTRGNVQTPHHEEQTTFDERQNTPPNEQQVNLNFENVKYERAGEEASEPIVEPIVEQEEEQEEQQEEQEEYSFDEAMNKAEIEEEARLHELSLEAAAELKVLVSPKYKNDLKAFKGLFRDKKYEATIRRADFVERLCDVLEEFRLKKEFHYYLIDFYRLRGYDPNELSPTGLRLYRILDERVGMKKQVNPGIYGGVAAGIVAGLHAVRPAIRDSHTFSVGLLVLVLIVLGVLVFNKLKKNHSALLVQAVIAIVLIVTQFAVIMTDFYGTIFGTVDDGNLVATLIMLAALAWLGIIIAVAVVKAIVRLVRK